MAETAQGLKWDVIARYIVHPRKLEVIELLGTQGPLSATELQDLVASRDPSARLQQVNFHTVWLAEKGVLVPSTGGSGVGNAHRKLYTLVPEVVG
jgi:hypothetical protein